MDTKQIFKPLLDNVVKQAAEQGRSLKVVTQELLDFADKRTKHLSQFDPVTKPNFSQLVEDETLSIGMELGMNVAQQGDAIDARIWGTLFGIVQTVTAVGRAALGVPSVNPA